ncbi:MAG: LytTR family DNA-binding domain-containing protein [Clostridia bacterium]|nr:LytTR family DNA-binding domain-containing protein [Clostridia bacterium]
MNCNELCELSIYIIKEYYKNNLEPFFKHMGDNVLWIGPAENHWIYGKENMLKAWDEERHDLTFSMSDISAVFVKTGNRSCEVVLRYKVYTYYPSGAVHLHRQRMHYTWVEHSASDGNGGRKKHFRVAMLHISNAVQMDEKDNIYPVHYENVAPRTEQLEVSAARIHIQGEDNSIYYLLPSSVIWVENYIKPNRCIIHTKEGAIMAMCSVSALKKEYSEHFLRAHSGYLINPIHARRLERFKLTMSDGEVIPIPEKKYTKFKKALNEGGWFE